MKLTLKGYKKHMGHEGPGYNVDLYIDGKKACHVCDQGDGGCAYEYWEVAELRKKFYDYLSTLPERDLDPDRTMGDKPLMVKPDIGMIMHDLLFEEQRDKRVRKNAATHIYFHPVGNPWKEYNIKAPFSIELKERMIKQNGPCVFLNETILGQVAKPKPVDHSAELNTLLARIRTLHAKMVDPKARFDMDEHKRLEDEAWAELMEIQRKLQGEWAPGRLMRFPQGDGFAFYLFKKMLPQPQICLVIHVPIGDAWEDMGVSKGAMLKEAALDAIRSAECCYNKVTAPARKR